MWERRTDGGAARLAESRPRPVLWAIHPSAAPAPPQSPHPPTHPPTRVREAAGVGVGLGAGRQRAAPRERRRAGVHRPLGVVPVQHPGGGVGAPAGTAGGREGDGAGCRRGHRVPAQAPSLGECSPLAAANSCTGRPVSQRPGQLDLAGGGALAGGGGGGEGGSSTSGGGGGLPGGSATAHGSWDMRGGTSAAGVRPRLKACRERARAAGRRATGRLLPDSQAAPALTLQQRQGFVVVAAGAEQVAHLAGQVAGPVARVGGVLAGGAAAGVGVGVAGGQALRVQACARRSSGTASGSAVSLEQKEVRRRGPRPARGGAAPATPRGAGCRLAAAGAAGRVALRLPQQAHRRGRAPRAPARSARSWRGRTCSAAGATGRR